MWCYCWLLSDQIVVRFVLGSNAYLCDPDVLLQRRRMEGLSHSSEDQDALLMGSISIYEKVEPISFPSGQNQEVKYG